MNAPVTIFPLDLEQFAKFYSYDEEKFAPLENLILDKINAYDSEYGPYLVDHLQKVSADMEEFMISEKYDSDIAHKIAKAYLLHDAGKILQDVKIWKFKENKNDRTDEENKLRPMHGILGETVLMDSISELDMNLTRDDFRHIEVIRYLMKTHHERLDGKGPLGLKGEQLDKVLQMATIVDAVDGKTKSLIDGQPKPISMIFDEVSGDKHAGQYNVELAERFRTLYREKEPARKQKLANALVS